jgi:urease accessory protein
MSTLCLLYPAHVTIEKVNEFFAGILHPLMVPTHVLALLVAGLIAARAAKASLTVSRIFVLALMAGLTASGFEARVSTDWMLPLAIGLSAIFVAANIHWQKPLLSFVLVFSLGILIGIDTAFPELSGKALWWCLLGALIGAGLPSFYVARLATKASRRWQHIALRVIASWIFAVSILMVALSLR